MVIVGVPQVTKFPSNPHQSITTGIKGARERALSAVVVKGAEVANLIAGEQPIPADRGRWVTAIAWAVCTTIAKFVTRVAFYYVGSENAVPAGRGFTGIGTAVCVFTVGVIACFIEFMIGVEDVGSRNAIPAIGEFAGVGARVIGKGIAIITLLVSRLSRNETRA